MDVIGPPHPTPPRPTTPHLYYIILSMRGDIQNLNAHTVVEIRVT